MNIRYFISSFIGSFRKKKKSIFKKGGAWSLVTKRQKIVISLVILTCAQFASQYSGRTSGLLYSVGIAFLTDVFILWSLWEEENKSLPWQILILPFLYSLSFGLFYPLVPARLITRILFTLLYTFGLYSVFLSQNIFYISTIRTIALVSAARIVSFVITFFVFLILSNFTFSLHLQIVPESLLIFAFSLLLIIHSLWMYALEKIFYSWLLWALALALSLFEITLILWFWPTNPTILAIFLACFFATIVGLSQIWMDKRLFRGVLWGFVWVSALAFSILIIFTSWGG